MTPEQTAAAIQQAKDALIKKYGVKLYGLATAIGGYEKTLSECLDEFLALYHSSLSKAQVGKTVYIGPKISLKALIGMCEDAYESHKRGGCHQEFLSEDRELILNVKSIRETTLPRVEEGLDGLPENLPLYKDSGLWQLRSDDMETVLFQQRADESTSDFLLRIKANTNPQNDKG